MSLEEKKRLAAEQERQRSQQGTPTFSNKSQPTIKNSATSAFNTDDFDLFGLKQSGSSNAKNTSSLDMFDPFSSQKPQQASNNLFAVNNTFGSLPLPPSAANPINRQQPMMGNQQFGTLKQSNPDPFDNLFSLKTAVQNPSSNTFGLPTQPQINQQPASKKNDPLDFLN